MKLKELKKNTIGWILYDFADSSFVTVMVTVLFSMYFKNHIVNQGELGTALWGRAVSVSMLMVAVLAPVLGAIADYSHSKKLLLSIFTYACVAFTSVLFFSKPGMIFFSMIIFIFANFAFNSANVFYNAFLPMVSEPDNLGKISGIAWGIGYLGGLVSLLLVMPVVKMSLNHYLNWRISFLIVAVFYAVFALPTMLWVKDKTGHVHRTHSYLKIAYLRLKDTVLNIRKYKELLKFLISYLLYNDGITVVISFASIYGAFRFNMNASEMIVYFIIAQPASFIGALIFGYLFDKIGAKKSISITLVMWIFTVLWVYFCQTKTEYYFIGLAAGFAMGSSQSNSRAFFSRLTPPDKMTEFFGFYSVTGRLASVIGPLLYGEIANRTGDQRMAILSIIIFFITGLIVLQFVKEDKVVLKV
ncbi:MAG TPA: MFS transporter [Candidatus Cloacimonadota bacterium]|nr:MFS transporter [Candidatus Cloacimonadota bacterium]HPM00888.1 MFS transporter [Candidatus Cloacimonadota bacterium]